MCCRCVLELHAIAGKKEEGGGRFAVAMTAQENQRFLAGIHDYTQYYSMLGRVNAEASDCSRTADRESIHEGIRSSVGFAQLNRVVFRVLEVWMEDLIRDQLEKHTAAKTDQAPRLRHTLALLLTDQGRHNEALSIMEAFDFDALSRPADIGAT